jgi:GNAT superfamily N-acetyltransferase
MTTSVEPISSPEDLAQIHYCLNESFGRQARDALWLVLNPKWETPEGQEEGTAQLVTRWKSITKDKKGRPNTVFLKATIPDPKDETKKRIVGMAIWVQASFVDGYGDPPAADMGDSLNALDPKDARFANQVFRSLWKRRLEVAKEKQSSDPPAIFVLDMCGVDPEYQRRGIAGKLVQWGLDEAKRRGGLECTTEASSMGRGAYMKLGFKPEGDGADMAFEVDDEFKGRDVPPNVFLRTGTKA